MSQVILVGNTRDAGFGPVNVEASGTLEAAILKHWPDFANNIDYVLTPLIPKGIDDFITGNDGYLPEVPLDANLSDYKGMTILVWFKLSKTL